MLKRSVLAAPQLSADVQLIRSMFDRATTPPFSGTDLGKDAFRTFLEVSHAYLMRDQPIVGPSIELGIGDGSASMFINGMRGVIFDVGLDMPFQMTGESRTFQWHACASHYREFVNASMECLPFDDATFGTVYSSETMFYGMNLKATAAEIHRILKPGGVFYCFNATDAWHKFPAIMAAHKRAVPSATYYSDADFCEFFTDVGLTCVRWQRFFSPAIEIITQRIGVNFSELNEAQRTALIHTFADLIAHECVHTSDGMHSFAVFKKPGDITGTNKRQYLEGIRCLECGSCAFTYSPDVMTCDNCRVPYSVVCGVPQMVRQDQRSFSPKVDGLNAKYTQMLADVTRQADAYVARRPEPDTDGVFKVVAPAGFPDQITKLMEAAICYRLKVERPELSPSVKIVKF